MFVVNVLVHVSRVCICYCNWAKNILINVRLYASIFRHWYMHFNSCCLIPYLVSKLCPTRSLCDGFRVQRFHVDILRSLAAKVRLTTSHSHQHCQQLLLFGKFKTQTFLKFLVDWICYITGNYDLGDGRLDFVRRNSQSVVVHRSLVRRVRTLDSQPFKRREFETRLKPL